MPQPPCSCCYDDAFDQAHAQRVLRDYRKKGPGRASVAVADALAGDDATGMTVLDIGAGVGSVHHQLLARGASSATDVDASGPYLAAAREEAERRGLTERVTHLHGDFVERAPEVEPADLVALDRVVCCYVDMPQLVGRAAERTRRRLAITLPPDLAIARFAIRILNAWEWITRSNFRVQAHPHAAVVAAARAAGLEPVSAAYIGTWRLLVFERPEVSAGSR
ncbi:MAG: class I SAM-dependent methyltransferase [Chloroflexota bacterium]